MTEPDRNRIESNHQSYDDDDEVQREELLGSMLETTKHYLEDDSCHGVLTDYVRTHRLPSKFSFENVCELVRCVMERTNIEQLPIDTEECVTWIANCIYEDPLANERTDILWSSIVSRIQNQQ